MFDSDTDAENMPETQLESDGDGSGKPPRKTAVGASGSGPKRWVAPSDAQKSKPVPYASIYEALQVEETANFEIMSRAHYFLVHSLDTSFFTPSQRKLSQQELLNTLWNGWHRSPESARAMTAEKVFANRPLEGLTHYQVFQLVPTARLGVIKAAYEYLERVYHPDNPATRDEAKYKIVREAWRVLHDRDLRDGYDEELAMGRDKT